MEEVFGVSFVNSDGRTVSVRDIGEQHVSEDFGGKFIPVVSDYFNELPMQGWMNNGIGGVPESYKKVAEYMASRRVTKTTHIPFEKSEKLEVVGGEVKPRPNPTLEDVVAALGEEATGYPEEYKAKIKVEVICEHGEVHTNYVYDRVALREAVKKGHKIVPEIEYAIDAAELLALFVAEVTPKRFERPGFPDIELDFPAPAPLQGYDGNWTATPGVYLDGTATRIAEQRCSHEPEVALTPEILEAARQSKVGYSD
jgi:hypothetical protein